MSHRDLKVMAVIDFIEANIDHKLTLQIVADATHYSKFYLHRTFSKTVGLTIHDYIIRRKLTMAAKQLVFSNTPILQIALDAGFESQQAFSDTFKSMYKKSPLKFRRGEFYYPLQLRFTLDHAPKTSLVATDMQIKVATTADIPRWMQLVHLVIDGFPHYQESDYLKALRHSIAHSYAYTAVVNEQCVGAFIYNHNSRHIEFLGVHPQYRRLGIARAFVQEIQKRNPGLKTVSVTTFRRGDAAENGSRQALKKLGFVEDELLFEYDYPTQKFLLNDHLHHTP